MKYMIFTLMLCLALVISCDKPDVEEPKDNQEQTDNTDDSQGGEDDEGGKDDENNDGGENLDGGNEFNLQEYIIEETPPNDEIWYRVIVDDGDGKYRYCDDGAINIETDAYMINGEIRTDNLVIQKYDDYISLIEPGLYESGFPCSGSCYKLRHYYFISLPSTVREIADYAFRYVSRLASLNISSGLTKIGKEAFNGCEYLMDIDIPSSVTEIGESAFYGCSSLTSIDIPSGVKTIGKSAFRECSSLAISLEIPQGITEIGEYTFSGCSSLTSIEIPSSVKTIGKSAFRECSRNLASITVETNNPRYDSRGNAIIETATNTLLLGCRFTKIPQGITEIGKDAFYGCSSLASIEIPSSVKTIGKDAFYGCGNLKSMYLRATTPPTLDSPVFSSCPAVFYVPMEAVEAYKNAEGWSKYASDRIVGYNF